MSELQQTLNGDKSRVETVVGELRFWITQRRCQKTLQHLPVSVYDKLPLLYPSDSPMSRLGKHKFFLRLHKHPNTWIVVVFKVKSFTYLKCSSFFIFVCLCVLGKGKRHRVCMPFGDCQTCFNRRNYTKRRSVW